LTYYSGDENEEDENEEEYEEEREDEENEHEEEEKTEKDTKEPLLREIWTDCGRCYSYNSQLAEP
jgi:hypothetical protein